MDDCIISHLSVAMVIRYRREETEMPMDSPGRAKAFQTLMNYSRLDYPPFDKLAGSLAEGDSFTARRVGRDRAALYYSFLLVDTIRFLSALRHGLGNTDKCSSGETVDTIWRPDEIRTALEHEFRRPMPVLVTSGLE